jgi:hypothetical protein
MAIFNSQPSRLGQVNLAGNADELFLKVFSGEIITVFEENNVMMPLHRVRTIPSGKSATFPVTGVAGALYHTPGESILSTPETVSVFQGGSVNVTAPTAASNSKYLSKFKHNEKQVFIDDVLVSSVFIADIDEMKNHYDVRSIYSTEIGRALAYTADKALLRTAIIGARRLTNRFGTTITAGQFDTFLGSQTSVGSSANDLVDALIDVAQKMDERNVPSSDRYAILPPSEYYKLLSGDRDAINRDYGNDGNGSVASGMVLSVSGIRILKSNHLPTADESSTQSTLFGSNQIKNDVSGTANAGYSGINFGTNRGIVFHREGLATVKLMDLSVESEYVMERMGTLMLAKYAMGHNVLREECLHELIAP